MHCLAVQTDSFPRLQLRRFRRVLAAFSSKGSKRPIKFTNESLSTALKRTVGKYATLRPQATLKFEMQRVHFLEFLLLFTGELLVVPGICNSFFEGFELITTEYLRPHVLNPKHCELSLAKFRTQFVWTLDTNDEFEASLPAIVEVFNEFTVSEQIGFNFDSA